MWENSEDFISPLHLENVDLNTLFEESCSFFEPKTGIRDLMDLLQSLNDIIEKDISGNITDFGHLKGKVDISLPDFLN